MKNSNDPIYKSKTKYNRSVSLFLVTLTFASLGVFIYSILIKTKNPHFSEQLRDASLAIFSTTFVATIADFILRKHFVEIFESEANELLKIFTEHVIKQNLELSEDYQRKFNLMMKEELTKSSEKIREELKLSIKEERSVYSDLTESKLNNIIEKSLPGHYQRLRQMGVVDIYKNLEESKFLDRIFDTENAEVIIKSIWNHYLTKERIDKFVNAIVQHNITFSILLLNYNKNGEAVRKRAASLGVEESELIVNIEDNLKTLNEIATRIYRLGSEKYKTHLRIRLHSNFVATPLIGINETILIGFYFSESMAFDSPQIKVVDKRFLYNRIKKHWEYQWTHNENVEIHYTEVDGKVVFLRGKSH